MEKEKLIDLLFANNERLMSELAGLRKEMERQAIETQRANEVSSRWEQRMMAAEKRAEAAEKRACAVEKKAESERSAMQDKIDRLLTLVEQLRNGDELRSMTARAEKAEKAVSDLLASGRTLRAQVYGTKSQGK